MIDSETVKKTAEKSGADLCGIAPVERFDGAPVGFRPQDIYPECKSVVVFAKKLPGASLFIGNCVPYTHVNSLITAEVDRMTLLISLELESLGIKNVLIPTDDPYEHWEPERMYGRAILSLRHAGWLAGLGVLGKNTLLMNRKYGNMIQIGAILADTELEPDVLVSYEGCPEDCTICLDVCPQNALGGTTVNQQLCRPHSNFITDKGYTLKLCNLCRSECPLALGID